MGVFVYKPQGQQTKNGNHGDKKYINYIKALARDLRSRQTPAEKVLRNHLRNNKLNIKRYRQFPLCIGTEGKYKRYIADFRSYQLQTVVELDGGYHDTLSQQEYDELRTGMINELGIRVIRFRNEEVLNEIEKVLVKLTHPQPLSLALISTIFLIPSRNSLREGIS